MAKELSEWSVSNGAKFGFGIEVKRVDEGCGVYANCAVEADALLASIPHQLVISPLTILERSALGLKLREKCRAIVISTPENSFTLDTGGNGATLELTVEEMLILFLLYDKVYGSPWAAYLSVLPGEIPAALLWKEEELDLLLDGSGLNEIVRSRRKDLISSHHKTRRFSGEYLDLDLSLEDYLWAYCVIKSRAYIFVPPENPEKLLSSLDLGISYEKKLELLYMLKSWPCLLPVLDSFNHKPGTKIVWFYTDTDIEFSTPVALPCGQVMNNYGPKSNEELLLFYGFTLNDSLQQQLDFVRLTLASPDRKAETLYLRFDLSELPKLIENAKTLIAAYGCEEGDAFELEALITVLSLLEAKLAGIDDCIERVSQVEGNKANCCLIYLKSQKQILDVACSALINQLEKNDGEAIAKNPLTPAPNNTLSADKRILEREVTEPDRKRSRK